MTICTHCRRHAFADESIATHCIRQLLQSATLQGFEIVAYCFMPDHVHFLCAGITDASDFRAFLIHYKKLTGYYYARLRREHLWQPGYYDHVLRHDEGTDLLVEYIVRNPVRAELTSDFRDYPFAWSAVPV